jgi:poly(hydroxyalkanoate) depolymerase family esterase
MLRRNRRPPPAATGTAPTPPSPPVFLPRYHARTAEFKTLSFENGAGSRAYKLYVPSASSGVPPALIVMLHGCTQTAEDFAIATRMNVLAEEHAFIVAYPEQSVTANPLRCWSWYERRDQRRDSVEASLIAGITQQVAQSYAVDRERIYVAGASAGAGAAAILGATYPDLYAAIGAHSGIAYGLADGFFAAFALMKTGRHKARASQPGKQRPIPTIVFQGAADPLVNPRNAERFADDPLLARCKRRRVQGQVPHGRSFSRTTYTDARGEVLLETWLVAGMGHAWSGGSEHVAYTDPHGPDASREFLRFFFSHRLVGDAPSASAAGGKRRRSFFSKRTTKPKTVA